MRKTCAYIDTPKDCLLRSTTLSRYVAHMPNDDQLTTSEAAAILSCSVATVNRMAADGRLPVVQKLPGLRGPNLYARADVDKLRDELADAAS